ncbi:MFS transporter [Kineococcus sp. SYSU DK018]|uniref:MFS transporter n=1 Tax=Kineococcus sp. SYSU DK018 TaxID=3383139 RepID=UPI003D7EA4C1
MSSTVKSDTEATDGRPSMLRQSVTGGIGAFVEQFDYNLYGVFAVFFASQFFPSDDPIVPLLQAFLVFALSFFLRPLGGALIGAYVDKHGRRSGLLLTVGMMTVGSLIIGVVPDYETIGVLAPVLLVVARSLQGMAAGGEVGTAMPFLAETAPDRRRGLWSSAHGIATGLSLLLVAGLAAVLVNVLDDDQMTTWGWRIGFLLSAALGAVALLIRRDVAETAAFDASAAAATTSSPIRRLFRTEWRSLLRVIGIAVAPLTFFYIWMSYLPTFAEVFGGLSDTQTRPWHVVSLVLFTLVVPTAGLLSDRFGRRPLLMVFAVGCMVLVPFTVLLLSSNPSVATYAALQCLGSVFVAVEVGVKTAVVSEQFGRSVRGAGVGLGYSVAAALFGGTASYTATWLTGDGHPHYLIAYLLLVGVIALTVYVRMPETRGIDLVALDRGPAPAPVN